MPSITQIKRNEDSIAITGDVVFLHGLGGESRATWEYKDDYGKFFWPDQLAKDHSDLAVWSVGYDSSPTKWKGRNMPVIDRAGSILDLLDAEGIGSRSLYFICHSLGGLIAKQILRMSADHPENSTKFALHRNTNGIVFFATPHTGSSIASLGRALPGFRGTDALSELSKGNAFLRDLKLWFVDAAPKFGYQGLAYFEAFKTHGVMVVDAESADPGGTGMRPTAYDADHLSICKLPDANDQRYKQVSKFIQAPQVDSQKRVEESSQLENCNFSIGVISDPPKDGRCLEFIPANRIVRYQSDQSEGITEITPRLEYLDKANRGDLLEGVPFYWNPFKCQFPSLDVKFVNNTNRTLVLESASLRVESSVPDGSPIIVFKDNNYHMKMQIQNEGWGRVSNPRIRCNILSTSATEVMPDPPIDDIEIEEPFAHEIEIPDFAEKCEVDLKDIFRELGVDTDLIESVGYRCQQMFVLHAMQNGLDTRIAKHLGRFPNLETNEAWKPFPDGYAVLAGEFSFDGVNKTGGSKHYKFPFRVRVFLFNIRFDQPMPPSYQYNAELRASGSDYTVELPLSQRLSSGEADRFTIRLACDQSSTHKFSILWRFVGGMSLESSVLKLNHLVTRSFAMENAEQATVGGLDPEMAEEPVVHDGNCIENSLMQMFELMGARNAQHGEYGDLESQSNKRKQ